jgi:hypothetical protein
MRPDDIWLMKDADDFLRYVKFEVINYGYLLAHLFMAIYLITAYYDVYCKTMTSFLITMLVWRVIDIMELHYIEKYDEDIRVIVCLKILKMITLITVTVMYIMNKDKLYND